MIVGEFQFRNGFFRNQSKHIKYTILGGTFLLWYSAFVHVLSTGSWFFPIVLGLVYFFIILANVKWYHFMGWDLKFDLDSVENLEIYTSWINAISKHKPAMSGRVHFIYPDWKTGNEFVRYIIFSKKGDLFLIKLKLKS